MNDQPQLQQAKTQGQSAVPVVLYDWTQFTYY